MNDNEKYDTAESAINAYRHYNQIKAEHLLADFLHAFVHDDREPCVAMEMAIETRYDELCEELAESKVGHCPTHDK
jgi:hypothetical protein